MKETKMDVSTEAKNLLKEMMRELDSRYGRDGNYEDAAMGCLDLISDKDTSLRPSQMAWVMCSAFSAHTAGFPADEVHPYSEGGLGLYEFVSASVFAAFCDVYGEEDFDMPEWANSNSLPSKSKKSA
jgi:hypothetical protein